MKKDLEKAKKRLYEKSLTIVVVKNSKVLFESEAHGISSLMEALDVLGDRMRSASVADKIVGKAAALLCIYAGVEAVYAPTMSLEAKRILEEHGIHSEWDILVEKILDASGRNICPFEKAAMKIENPKKAYEKLKAILEGIKSE